MDMEWDGSRYEDGEVASLENGSPGEVYKEEKMDDLEESRVDMENDHKHDNGGSSVAKDKEKSRESGKHRSKDRKKGRREEKDHKSKDRERSKERDKTHDVSKEKGDKEQELRDKDRISIRERRKEEIEVHNKDKEKSRDKTREKDHDRDKYREKDRERDKDREREHERGKERDRDRELEKERSLEQEFERGKERARDREKDYERNKGRERDREKVDKEWERERGKEKDREREKDKDREREKERDRGKEREREKEKGKDRDREREKERDKDWDRLEREKGKEKTKEKEKEKDRDKNWEKDRDKERGKDRERDKVSGRNQDEGYGKEMVRGKEREKDEKLKVDYGDNRDVAEQGKEIQNNEVDTHDRGGTKDKKLKTERAFDGSHSSTSKLQDRIKKMKEERLKKKSEGVSEVLAWVSKSRKLEEKIISEKEKALHISKAFEEQDRVDQGDSEDEDGPQHTGKDLAGVKVLHGLDKVIEGGAVVLTLKDQNILADGDINEEIDVLENVEIGEQKQRDGAYSAAKKKTGIYTDKFNDDPGSQKRMLPQYDDPMEDEGVTLDESGQFTGKAEKKLEELRKRLQGSSTSTHFEDLTSSGKTSSDYYTHEEMLQFKKPKKKKSLRKKEKLDLDALEAEAISAGLGAGDLGSRNEGKRQAAKEEQENADAEMRSNLYKAAYAKAEEASKALRHEQTLTIKDEEDDSLFFGDVDDDLYRSVEKARKLALKRQDETAASGPQAVALLAVADNETEESQNPVSGDPQEKRLVFTEMEEFVSKIKLDEDVHKPETENVFEEEDDAPKSFDQEKDEGGGWMEVNETADDELPVNEEKEDLVPDTAIHEPAVGKGLSGALQLLKERGTLKETVDWGGRNMDKKKSKLVGIYDNDGQKEIRIERTDEFGRIMTPKEAFRMISHKFHGKGPGKMKLEKRMKQYHEELKLKQMKASDTPSQSMERMREAQARLKTPYLVLSGHVKPGQTSDPRSGFATVEKDHPGSLTPMLGDRKVEHFLGLKRKAEPGDMGPPKKPKT